MIIRERLVCGLRCDNTQLKLKFIKKIDIEKQNLKMCRYEKVTNNVAELLNRNHESAQVNKFKVTPKPVNIQRQNEAKNVPCGRAQGS